MAWKYKYRCKECGYEADVYEGRGLFRQQITAMICPDCNTVQNIVVGGISSADLSTVLRVLTGMTTQELEQAWRLRMVDELLRYTPMQIDEIARRCGYSSATSLSRYLAQHTGLSPTERRRELRKKGDLGKFGV